MATPNEVPVKIAPALTGAQIDQAIGKLQNRFNNMTLFDEMRARRRHGHTGWRRV